MPMYRSYLQIICRSSIDHSFIVYARFCLSFIYLWMVLFHFAKVLRWREFFQPSGGWATQEVSLATTRWARESKWISGSLWGWREIQIHPNTTELFSLCSRPHSTFYPEKGTYRRSRAHLMSKRCQGLESVCQQQPMIVHICPYHLNLHSYLLFKVAVGILDDVAHLLCSRAQ